MGKAIYILTEILKLNGKIPGKKGTGTFSIRSERDFNITQREKVPVPFL